MKITKKILLLFGLLLILPCSSLKAQLEAGVKMGYGEVNFKHSGDYRVGNIFRPDVFWNIQGEASYELVSNLRIKSGIGVLKVTSKEYIDFIDYLLYIRTHHQLYISIPVAIQYRLFWGFRIEGGWVFNYLQSRWMEANAPENNNFYIYKITSKYNPTAYWGLSLTFLKYFEIGYNKHYTVRYFARTGDGILADYSYKTEFKNYFYLTLKYPINFKKKQDNAIEIRDSELK